MTEQPGAPNEFSKTVRVQASPLEVWKALTVPKIMAEWMYDGEISIVTDWKVGSPIIIEIPAGEYKPASINSGFVLEFDPERALSYSHLSSLSRLPDQPEHYTVLNFTLMPDDGDTHLTLRILNFPTEAIFKHMEFYWNITLEIFGKHVANSDGLR